MDALNHVQLLSEGARTSQPPSRETSRALSIHKVYLDEPTGSFATGSPTTTQQDGKQSIIVVNREGMNWCCMFP